jgi:zinc transporter ZupT
MATPVWLCAGSAALCLSRILLLLSVFLTFTSGGFLFFGTLGLLPEKNPGQGSILIGSGKEN